MPPPHNQHDQDARWQRAAARADLVLAQVHALLADLDRDQIPIPSALKDAHAALTCAAHTLHEHAGQQAGYADALLAAIREQDRRAATRLAERAETEARHLMELATSAQIEGRLLPWGVEQTARSLVDWARRLRAHAV